MKENQIVAVFDFDGTITYGDSFIRFILFSCGYVRTFLGVVCLSLPIFLFLCRRYGRQELKEAFVKHFFLGMDKSAFTALGKDFAIRGLSSCVRPKAMERIQWHKQQGHRCVLVSASIDAYLTPWVAAVGFDDLLCSRVEYDAEGCVTGKLIGKNCRGKEKVDRLEALLGPKSGYEVYAYGDSDGDSEMLAWSDHPEYKPFRGF